MTKDKTKDQKDQYERLTTLCFLKKETWTPAFAGVTFVFKGKVYP
jgi:hypothetical protein